MPATELEGEAASARRVEREWVRSVLKEVRLMLVEKRQSIPHKSDLHFIDQWPL